MFSLPPCNEANCEVTPDRWNPMRMVSAATSSPWPRRIAQPKLLASFSRWRLMKRRTFLQQGGFYGLLFAAGQLPCLADSIPGIEQGKPIPSPIAETHFPDRLHLFIWRNWELANVDRMAQVLGTTQEKV